MLVPSQSTPPRSSWQASPRTSITYQDILDAPEHPPAHRRHAPHPPTTRGHDAPAHDLSASGGGDGGPGGWRIFYEPELHLAGEVLVPDLAAWRRERMPELPDTAYFTLAPDWACEILSTSTRAHDLVHKRPIYAAAGVAYLWLVDPVDQVLEAFELDNGPRGEVRARRRSATRRVRRRPRRMGVRAC